MKNISKSHKKILSELFKSRGRLDSYTLFRRSRLSFYEFSSSTNFLFVEELAVEDGDYILLTQQGKKLVNQGGKGRKDGCEWRNVPEKYRAHPVATGAPYIPDITLLDKRTFNIDDSNVD